MFRAYSDIIIGILSVVISIAAWICAVYIAAHFIVKYW